VLCWLGFSIGQFSWSNKVTYNSEQRQQLLRLQLQLSYGQGRKKCARGDRIVSVRSGSDRASWRQLNWLNAWN